MSLARLTGCALLAVLAMSWDADPVQAQSAPRTGASPGSTLLDPPLRVLLGPGGAAATELARRLHGALAGRPIFGQFGGARPMASTPDPLATTIPCIEVDLSDPEAVWIHVSGLPDGPHIRRVPRTGVELDESTLEAATTVIVMAAESLRARQLHGDRSQTQGEGVEASPAPLSGLGPARAAGPPPVQSSTRSEAAQPSPPLADAPVSRASREPVRAVSPAADASEDERDPRVATELSLGYEVVRWGPGLWPQGVAAGLRVGPRASDFAVRVEAWLTPTRAHFEGPPVLSLAVYGGRALWVYRRFLGASVALEAGAGIGIYAVRAQAISTVPAPMLRDPSWQRSVCFHARLALIFQPTSTLLFIAAAGVDLDRAQVVYGTQYLDGFAALHHSSRARPALSLGIAIRL